MKVLYTILLGSMLAGCTPQSESGFAELPCNPEETPAFDGRKVTFLDDTGQPLKDTILNPIEKRRTIFAPCRSFTYEARFYDDQGQLITKEQIRMTATGRRWLAQPEMQDEIVIQYAFAPEDQARARAYQLNEGLRDGRWTSRTRTGIVENVEEVWMHPFRANQYAFTETAPFPEIKYPLEVGRSWTGQLRIQKGWGDWENTSGNFSYEVTARASTETQYGVLDDCWKVQSRSKYPFGVSYLDYWFHEEWGFVKMHYRNYGDQRLEIELVRVEDPS